MGQRSEVRSQRSEDRGHPSSPYGLRRDKEGRRQMAEFRIADFGFRISKKAENRDFPVGAAFSRDLAI